METGGGGGWWGKEGREKYGKMEVIGVFGWKVYGSSLYSCGFSVGIDIFQKKKKGWLIKSIDEDGEQGNSHP